MSFAARRTRAALLLVVALLAALVATGPGPAARAADDKGLANGTITFPQGDEPGIKVLWFDRNWNYLGQKGAPGGGYSIWLAPGTYHLQFVDQRPAYDVRKYAPTDILVTVRAGEFTTRNVAMRPGAAITGTARAAGKPLGGARIVAANKAQQSFSTTANTKGEFAVGGLPQGQYSLFTYDRRKAWVGKSTWAGAVKPGKHRNVGIALTKRGGSMTVYLFTPGDRPLRTKTSVTVTSKQNGQWWTATARNGTAVLRGLYPGAYTLEFTGAGPWFATTGTVRKASVRPGRMTFGEFAINKRGGWVTGEVVDGGDQSYPMGNVEVLLYDADGSEVASATSDAEGSFRLDGRLATQSEMTIIATPPGGDDSWMQGADWCMFTKGAMFPISVRTGEETWAGSVPLPRSTARGQPDRCL